MVIWKRGYYMLKGVIYVKRGIYIRGGIMMCCD